MSTIASRQRVVFALSIMAIVGGCSPRVDRGDLTASTGPRWDGMLGAGPRPGARAAAVELPPDAGRYTNVYEKRAANVQRQDIVLSGSVKGLPANKLEVVAVRSGGDDDPNIGRLKPSEDGIAAELRSHFPGVAMQVVVQAMQNDYGPFGLAMGKSAHGARCIYAWQWIDNVGNGDPRLRRASLFGSHPTVSASVRIAMCRADKTADQLAGYVERLHIEPSMLQPGGQPVREPIVATAFTEEPKAAHATADRPKRHARARRKPIAVATARPEPPPEAAAPVAIVVSAPPRLKPAQTGRQPAFAQAPGDPTPDPFARAHSVAPVAPPLSTRGAPAQLDRSLPPEAYLGPSARTKAARPVAAESTEPAAVGGEKP